VETTKKESTQLVVDTKVPLQAAVEQNSTQSNTKDLCDPKRQTHNLKNEIKKRVTSSDKIKNANSPSI